MEDSKALKFFQEVCEKTMAGRIRWEPTANDRVFIAPIGGQFTLSLFGYKAQDHEPRKLADAERVILVLKDRDDRELLTVSKDIEGVDAAQFFELFEVARRQAYSVDEKIDIALGALGKL